MIVFFFYLTKYKSRYINYKYIYGYFVKYFSKKININFEVS